MGMYQGVLSAIFLVAVISLCLLLMVEDMSCQVSVLDDRFLDCRTLGSGLGVHS
jgi:hypothetical protein